MEKIAAVILAAGKGTRMGNAEGSDIPKVMFKVAGQPIIKYSVENIKQAGVEKIYLVVGYKKEMVEEFMGDEVEYVVQEEQLGTGHAVATAREALVGKSEGVLVCPGDAPLFKTETIRQLIETYEGGKPARHASQLAGVAGRPTIALLTAEMENPFNYGRIIRDENGNIMKIVEEKDCDEEQKKIKETNPSFYIFNNEWLWENLTKIGTTNIQHEYYLTDLIKMAREQGKEIVSVPVSEEREAWGINTLEQLEQVENVLKSGSRNYGYL